MVNYLFSENLAEMLSQLHLRSKNLGKFFLATCSQSKLITVIWHLLFLPPSTLYPFSLAWMVLMDHINM